MEVAIPLYDGFTALDAIGPYDVLSRIPGAQVKFVALEPGAKVTENGMLSMNADIPVTDVTSPDVLVVPGGYGTRRLLQDEPLLNWIRSVHETSTFTTSVCTGSLLLGGAGILDGLEATTHWASMDLLATFGAKPTSRRVVEQGKVITAAGVSSGIDMALTLAAKLVHEDLAKAIQLGIEYDPQPPFDCGSPEKAGPEMTELLRGIVAKENEEAARRLEAAQTA
jgi:putative intracellular protease/amidase